MQKPDRPAQTASSSSTQKDDKAERLARALRENLKRRKAAERLQPE
ncbi:MAG: hypothetical protein KGJ06_07075 [Pseudomonadota bacterium]|nr:hypothetical protein [Pseudomonadota bacterium]